MFFYFLISLCLLSSLAFAESGPSYDLKVEHLDSSFTSGTRDECYDRVKLKAGVCLDLDRNDVTIEYKKKSKDFVGASIYDRIIKVECKNPEKATRTYFCFVRVTPKINLNSVSFETDYKLDNPD